MLFLFVMPYAQITFLTPPSSGSENPGSLIEQPLPPELLFGVVLVAVLVVLLSRRALRSRLSRTPGRKAARPRPPQVLRNPILVDGSNVMHWKDETPGIHAVQAVVDELKKRGFTPGVMFDANAGYKLAGRYLDEREFATLLTLPESQIFVVPKGTQADPHLLNAARGLGARVVTRDRFRDWAEAHPEVKEPGFLIRGGYRDSGVFWLDETLAPHNAGVQG